MSLPGITTTQHEAAAAASQPREVFPAPTLNTHTTPTLVSPKSNIMSAEGGSISLPKAMSSPSKTLPSPAAARESPAATETKGRGITPQLRGTRGNEGSSLAQRLSQSLTLNTPPVLSATTAENDDGSGKSKEELLALAHREIQAAFDSGLISAPELEAAKSRLSTTSYHFVPSRSATPVKPATTPSQPRSQGQHQPTPPPQRPTPPRRPPGGKSRGGAQKDLRGGRRHVASAPEPNVLELSGLVVGDLVGGAVGRYKKVESRFNGRPVYEDVVRKDRYIYYLSEYGGIWSVGFEVGSKAVALFNRSEAEEPQLASLSWSKYVGRTETNAAKFAVDEAIKLSKVLAEDVVVEDAPGGSDAAAEAIAEGSGVSLPASSSSDTSNAGRSAAQATTTPITTAENALPPHSASSSAQSADDIMANFLEGDRGSVTQIHRQEQSYIVEEIVPPLPQLQSGFIEDALGAPFLERP